MGNRAKNVIAGCAAFAALAITSEIHALTFFGSTPGDNPGEELQASVSFTLSNNDLVVTLSNAGTYDSNDAPDILTGIFFTINGDPLLTPLSAAVAPGSFVTGHHVLPGFNGNIGSEWAYRNELTGAPLGDNEGISSTSLKWFGKKNLFPGSTIKGAGSFGGVQFGLTTDFDFPANDRGSIKNQALIENSTVFTFDGLPEGFSLSDVTNVTFKYGTTLKEPEFIGVAAIPEPAPITLVGAGLLGMLSLKRRKAAR